MALDLIFLLFSYIYICIVVRKQRNEGRENTKEQVRGRQGSSSGVLRRKKKGERKSKRTVQGGVKEERGPSRG